MSHRDHLRGARWILASLAVLLAASAWAQDSGQDDLKEINSYRLTDAGLAKFSQATRNLGPLEKNVHSNCGTEEDSGDGNGQTIDRTVARLNAIPGVQQAIQSAGMKTREYVVFSMAVFQAGMADWALGQPGGKLPPGMSMENVNFYRKHQADMQKIGQQQSSSGCDERAEE